MIVVFWDTAASKTTARYARLDNEPLKQIRSEAGRVGPPRRSSKQPRRLDCPSRHEYGLVETKPLRRNSSFV